jgi:hypothetical protein
MTVTVTAITGVGELRLDLKSSGTGLVDSGGIAIAGGFSSGQMYLIDRTAPGGNATTGRGVAALRGCNQQRLHLY